LHKYIKAVAVEIFLGTDISKIGALVSFTTELLPDDVTLVLKHVAKSLNVININIQFVVKVTK
jgi:hypothetical protein